MIELARFASAHPSGELQAVVMLDEADLYLPASGKPASKAPIENALRRFRSQGIGLLLASQNPGDFDYRSRSNILTWIVGKVTQTTSQKKLAPVFGDAGAGALERLATHATGEFCFVRDEAVRRFQANRNLLPTDQLPDADILRAARECR
jgi:DNA helicase HerA-like ATPase